MARGCTGLFNVLACHCLRLIACLHIIVLRLSGNGADITILSAHLLSGGRVMVYTFCQSIILLLISCSDWSRRFRRIKVELFAVRVVTYAFLRGLDARGERAHLAVLAHDRLLDRHLTDGLRLLTLTCHLKAIPRACISNTFKHTVPSHDITRIFEHLLLSSSLPIVELLRDRVEILTDQHLCWG